MRITVLAGGVGGATFLAGVKTYLRWEPYGPAPDQSTREPGDRDVVTAIVNTADDIRLHGLQVCPDLDSCLYTLAGVSDRQRGWGRTDETWTVSAELAGYAAEAPWFSLGDRDIATHLVRTRMLDAGYPLSQVTEALSTRWQPGVRLLPMTDDRVETHVVVTDPVGGEERVALHFQEWWIRYGAALPAHSITPIGAAEAAPAPGVSAALETADVILIAPSNPVVSIDTILAVPGIDRALRAAPAPVVAVAPLIGGRPVRGHADSCLRAIGVEVSAAGIGRHYGARTAGGLLDGYLVAEGDDVLLDGLRVVNAPLLMTDPKATAEMVSRCLEIADACR